MTDVTYLWIGFGTLAGLLVLSIVVSVLRGQSRERLREEERRTRAVLESITDAFLALDRGWRFTYVNRQAEVLLGRTREDLLGKSLWVEYAPVIGTEFERCYRRAVDENVTVTFEAFYPPHDRWYEVHTYPSADGLSLYFRDINERRQARERERQLLAEAAEANAKFRAFFEQGALFASIMDVDGTILEPNRLSWEACGYTREQILGKPFWECPWWTPSPALAEQIRAASAQAAAGQSFRAEVPYFVADGSGRMVDLHILPIKDEEGRVMFLAPTGTDITDRKQAEEDRRRLEHDLRQLAADLSEADRRKNEFLAMLAHELRNPLAPIRTALQILRLRQGDEESVLSASEMMERQIAQMVRLVDELLDVSRISLGKLDLRKEPVELAAIVRQAVETSRPAIEAARHELTVELPPQPVVLHADLVRLAQALGNLLNNSSKYSPPGSRIRLRAEVQGQAVTVSVKDTGVGIAADMLPRIFEMFTQVNESLERSQGGLGIGLTLVQRLVEMHGGSVEAFSEGRGRGSEFVVYLPLPVEPQTAQPPALPAGGAAEIPLRRILVVDDNRDAAISLSMLLELSGHTTLMAHDGAEAVEAAAAFRPELVLLDIGLPKLNGYEVAAKLREEPWGREITLVALTGWGQEEDRRKSREAGFDDHLVKPVAYDTLLGLLASLPGAGASTRG